MSRRSLPIQNYVEKKPGFRPTKRCAYLKDCYLADELKCYGYKIDCPLYMRSNGEPCNESRFHAAMDTLILRTKAKHDRINQQTRGTGSPK